MPEKTLIEEQFEKVSLIKTINSSFLFGADAFRGNTRSHPEHDGEDHIGRRYCIGDDTGE